MSAWALALAWLALHPLAGGAETAGEAAPIELAVPAVSEPFAVDGEAEEPFWTKRAARSGAFVDDSGRPARPFSEAHFAWDKRGLRLALYAADHDITKRDAFRLLFSSLADGRKDVQLTLTPAARVRFGQMQMGIDLDGTLDDPRGDDEEWVVEVALPWAALGVARPAPGTRLTLTLAREDATTGEATPTVSHWGTPSGRGVLVLAPAR